MIAVLTGVMQEGMFWEGHKTAQNMFPKIIEILKIVEIWEIIQLFQMIINASKSMKPTPN